MPHERKRYAASRVKAALTHGPIVGVLGQRQVGKTTLLETVCEKYETLDASHTRQEIEKNAAGFLEDRPAPFGIDEAQLAPNLFPALKEWVRLHKTPGQFVLAGSIRFTSRMAIRESLTGRIVTTEVLPFTVAEAEESELPRVLEMLSKTKRESDLLKLEKRAAALKRSWQTLERYLQTGGLPGIAFFRDGGVRAERWTAQLDTLLNRDFRIVYPSTLTFSSIRALVAFLAQNQGLPFEAAAASRFSQISPITLKKALFALEALFLIRHVPCEGTRKGTYFLEDQGMATWLIRRGLEQDSDVCRALFANLRQEIHYRPQLNGRVFQYRTRNLVEVPLVFEAANWMIGVIPTLDAAPNPKILGAALSFLNRYPKAKIVIACHRKEAVMRSNRQFWIPAEWLV